MELTFFSDFLILHDDLQNGGIWNELHDISEFLYESGTSCDSDIVGKWWLGGCVCVCVGGWGMALSRLRYWDLLTLIHIMYVYNQVDWTKWSFWLMVKWKLCFQSLPHPSFSSSIALVAYYAVSYLYPWMHNDLYYIIDMLWYKMKKYEYSFIHSLNNEFIFNKWNALMCYNKSVVDWYVLCLLFG